jgi:hypothetical protein
MNEPASVTGSPPLVMRTHHSTAVVAPELIGVP